MNSRICLEHFSIASTNPSLSRDRFLIVEMQHDILNLDAPFANETLPWIESLGFDLLGRISVGQTGLDADYAFHNSRFDARRRPRIALDRLIGELEAKDEAIRHELASPQGRAAAALVGPCQFEATGVTSTPLPLVSGSLVLQSMSYVHVRELTQIFEVLYPQLIGACSNMEPVLSGGVSLDACVADGLRSLTRLVVDQCWGG